ncbi:MAG TPA: GGDEF domain-containing protein, partial [Acidobacteriaceae bacterium]
SSMAPAPAGTLVEVDGVSGAGDFAPIVANPKVRNLSAALGLPPAKSVTLTRLQSGAEDGQWVEVEGVVHSLFESPHDVTLQLAMTDGTMSATLLKEDGVQYGSLVDARVLLRANAAPLFNNNRQMIGARLLTPNMAAITLLEPAPPDPFGVPVRGIDTLSGYDPVKKLPRRVHVRGRVTLQWPGSLLCIESPGGALCADTSQAGQVAPGAMVDLVGFPAAGHFNPRLTDAVFRSAGSSAPVEGTLVTAPQAAGGEQDSRLIRIDGVLLGRDLAASDTRLMLAADNLIFPVILPKGQALPKALALQLENGARVQVTGICSVQMDTQKSARGNGQGIPQGFRILLRSSGDVIVLQRASWWTPGHALLIVSAMLTVSLLALGCITVLRVRIKRQAELITESEARYRHMAQHDALTGLPTRALLHERLNLAIERADQFGGGLAVLMLDLDGFKQINDTLGHQAGDQTLQVAARRIRGVVRETDTAARTGGDEFVVLIDNLHTPAEAELVASKVVSAFSAPLTLAGRQVPLGVSVGVCAAFGAGLEADELLKNADLALYRAKAAGRSRFEVFQAEPAEAEMPPRRSEASRRPAAPRQNATV